MSRLVVKIGGAAMESRQLLAQCAAAIRQLVIDGNEVAVVHGGGSILTRTLGRLCKNSTFIGGFRLTDAETRDVAVMVLAGLVNKSLVAALGAEAQAAVGICGGDGLFVRARRKDIAGNENGFIGEVASIDARVMEAIWGMGSVPVIASVALGYDGEYYNINADELASSCAAACQAAGLIFLTDVPGVKGGNGEVVHSLTSAGIAELREKAIVYGGMLPKLRACEQAVRSGVGRVRIVPADHARFLPEFDRSPVGVGTEVTA